MSAAAEDVVIRSAAQRARTHRVERLADLAAILAGLDGGGGPRTLDLLGHATRGARLLRLGATVIDMCDPAVAAWFEHLASGDAIERLELVAVRLLGCETAVHPAGQLTLRRLASTLGLPVYGTRRPLMRSHYDEHGFCPASARVLVESAELPSPPRRLAA